LPAASCRSPVACFLLATPDQINTLLNKAVFKPLDMPDLYEMKIPVAVPAAKLSHHELESQ
jgi:hypothetical protein